MTIGKKISLACLVLVALTILLGTVSILNIGRINTAVNAIVVDSLPGEASIGRLDGLMKEKRAFALRHMLMETPAQKSQAESAMADAQSLRENDHDSTRPRVVWEDCASARTVRPGVG